MCIVTKQGNGKAVKLQMLASILAIALLAQKAVAQEQSKFTGEKIPSSSDNLVTQTRLKTSPEQLALPKLELKRFDDVLNGSPPPSGLFQESSTLHLKPIGDALIDQHLLDQQLGSASQKTELPKAPMQSPFGVPFEKLGDAEVSRTQQTTTTEPKPKPFNSAQERLFNRLSKDPKRYIKFIDPEECDKLGLSPQQRGWAKRWSEPEKQELERAFLVILARAPGLVMSATAGQPISLCRVGALQSKADRISLLGQTGIIFVTDLYCEKKGLASVFYLIHELLHLADAGCRLSFSREWISFARPLMTRKNSSVSGAVVFQDPAACENLQEAFAYYFQRYLCGDEDDEGYPQSMRKFAKHFLEPTEKELAFNQHFTSGQMALRLKNNFLARREFLLAVIPNPIVGRVYLGLADTYHHTLHNIRINFNYCDQACKIFKVAGVPQDEFYFAHALYCRNWAYSKLRKVADDSKTQ